MHYEGELDELFACIPMEHNPVSFFFFPLSFMSAINFNDSLAFFATIQNGLDPYMLI